jgi:hypothetical protein
MQRALVSSFAVCLFVSLCTVEFTAAAAAQSEPGVLCFGHDLVRQKQQVPDDPLAGLPTDDGQPNRRKGTTGGGKASCAILASAANERDIGDLRATLAFVKVGPRAWSCPARGSQFEVRLRVRIDGPGKITEVDATAGDGIVAGALAKRLVGKTVSPRSDGATVGVVVLRMTSAK